MYLRDAPERKSVFYSRHKEIFLFSWMRRGCNIFTKNLDFPDTECTEREHLKSVKWQNPKKNIAAVEEWEGGFCFIGKRPRSALMG